MLARQLATIENFHHGRVSLHVITGGNAKELRQDGNTLDDKDERYARTSEWLDIIKQEWTSEKPFDYTGKYYQVEGGFSQVKPTVPIHVFVGGGSDAAIDVSGKHADTFALWGESYAQVRDVTGACVLLLRPSMAVRRRASACRCARSSPTPRRRPGPRPTTFSPAPPRCRTRPAIASRPMAMPPPVRSVCWRWPSRAPASTSGCGPRWRRSPAPTATPRALVGTPEQVAEVFADYYDLGVSHFLIRGFDPLIDAIDYGRELIPLTRELIAARDRTPRSCRSMKRLISRRRSILAAFASSAHAETTLIVGDQKGNARAVMEASGVLKDVPYKIEWKEFAAAAPLLEALGAGALDSGLVGDAPFTLPRRPMCRSRRSARSGRPATVSPCWCRRTRRSRASTI